MPCLGAFKSCSNMASASKLAGGGSLALAATVGIVAYLTAQHPAPVDSTEGTGAWRKLTSRLQTHSYDQERFNLTDSIAAVFEDWPKELSDIHEFFPESASWQLRTLDNDTKTLFHEHYYASPHYEAVRDQYYEFVQHNVLPLFDAGETGFAVQRDPTFRVHLPQLRYVTCPAAP
ncbi:unnamed protein product [Symbiodinium sp. KB8]|nr:unnamed protein product [Symbiodinium sp. KB8]